MTVYIRGVNLAEISGKALKFVLFGPSRLGINILQNLYNGLNIFRGGGTKTYEKFVKSGIICDLIIVQSQTCWILKTKYYF